MNKNRIKTLVPVFFLLLTVLCAYKTTLAASLELSSGDYTTATLNEALNGYDSLTVSDGTVNFNLNGTKIGTNTITVSSGILNWNANNPNGNDYIFDGEITVNSGAELYLNGADPLGNSSSDTGSWRTLNIGGTLRLSSGSNKTMRRVTLNLTGGTVTGHTWQYRSNASVLQATSGDSTFESNLLFRSDVTAPKITVSENATLTITGSVSFDANLTSLTFDGKGTTKIATLKGNGDPSKVIDQIDVSNGNLVLTKAIGRLTPIINVTNGGTLQLAIGDTLGANGDAITLNIGEGSALDLNAASAGGITNQTGRDMTINLTGATMKNGRLHFFSPEAKPTEINILASSKTTEISSTLQLRTQSGNQEDHLLNVENGDAAVDLLLSGTIESYNAKQYLTLTGGGTTKLTGNVASNVIRVTLDNSTLLLGKNNPMTNATTLQTNGTFDMKGYSATVGLLTGSGAVTNTAEDASVLTIDNSGSDSFSGTISGNVNVVKTGAGTWAISGENDWSNSSLEIQNGTVTVDKTHSSGNGRRLLAGTITIGENGKLSLKDRDALGNVSGSGGSWENHGLDLDILGTLEITGAGNQTSRYINYNLYGGTINITRNDGKILVLEDLTTINSFAKYGTEDVTETSVINGWLAARDDSRMVTLNVEDGLPDTDLRWTGFLKYENGSYAANLTKTGAGTLRLTSASGTTFDLKNGMTISDGRIILDGAAVTGADVTIAEGATFAAVNGSSISNDLVLNGNYELALADIAASDTLNQLSIDGNILFGQEATASINANGDVNWYALNGKTLMSFSSDEQAAGVFAQLCELLASDSNLLYVNLMAEGSSILIGTNFNAIPEPASWLLLLLGAVGLVWRSRRSR